MRNKISRNFHSDLLDTNVIHAAAVLVIPQAVESLLSLLEFPLLLGTFRPVDQVLIFYGACLVYPLSLAIDLALSRIPWRQGNQLKDLLCLSGLPWAAFVLLLCYFQVKDNFPLILASTPLCVAFTLGVVALRHWLMTQDNVYNLWPVWVLTAFGDCCETKIHLKTVSLFSDGHSYHVEY